MRERSNRRISPNNLIEEILRLRLRMTTWLRLRMTHYSKRFFAGAQNDDVASSGMTRYSKKFFAGAQNDDMASPQNDELLEKILRWRSE